TATGITPQSHLSLEGNPLVMESGGLLAVGSGLIYREGNAYTVVTESGDGVKVTLQTTRKGAPYLDVEPFLSANRTAGTVYGLLGTNGVCQEGLTACDGEVIRTPVSED